VSCLCCSRWMRLTETAVDQTHGGGESAADVKRIYREAQKELRHWICEVKSKCCTVLDKTVDDNLWGKPYKVVTRKLRGPPATIEPQTVRDIAAVLFPKEDGGRVEILSRGGDHDGRPLREPLQGAGPKPGLRCRARDESRVSGWRVQPLPEGRRLLRPVERRSASASHHTRKAGGDASYRPLYLLDDVGKIAKIFEFLLTIWNSHMSTTGTCCPSGSQASRADDARYLALIFV